ncbi:hypothetical protein GBAG_3482 [Buttiauxella agrestis ATCC 33320]|uniref:Uncharacterized protein n=2 Tax=Buttiauxella agrestis TaxID=82977 RepID=A0A085G305_9ENTR|nr:hypothetical protein GBAG_3482 [Buttiauxella agrestis ATCC 33320]
MMPIAHAANQNVKARPDFKDYPVEISKGPFASQLEFSDEEKNYSSHWKEITINEFKKSENIAGHYRIYTDDKSSGKECLDHQGGVCGWVIDKLSGKIVMQLPSINGTNVYQQVADNGTPVGEEFRIETRKNSYLIILTGQAIPQKIEHDENGIPLTYPCQTTYYILKKNQFSKIFEDKNGCDVD